ncbi:MAG: hypothetical protein ACKOWF_04630 [Chloroflexota bacterium]
MDASRFDRLARIVARRRGRRGFVAALAGCAGVVAAAAGGARPAAAGFGRPLGMTCAGAGQCSVIGACGWPAAVSCESGLDGEPVCCLAGGEPCNADIECCGPLACLMADDSCGAGSCGAESAAGGGGWEDSTPVGVACANGAICAGDWETCGPGVFVAGEPECCLADGAPCGGANADAVAGVCCHSCVNGACMTLGRGGLAALEDLNLRAGPGTGFAILGVVPAGAIVADLPYRENGYQLVELPWITGWVIADGLSGHAG